MTITKESAAQRLGMAPDEVSTVVDTDDGPVVKTFDGQLYVLLDTRPDWFDQRLWDAQPGVAFVVKPYDKYEGTFPVHPHGRQLAASLAAELESPGEPLPDEEPAPSGRAKGVPKNADAAT